MRILTVLVIVTASVSPAFAQAAGAGTSCRDFVGLGAGGQAAAVNRMQASPTTPQANPPTAPGTPSPAPAVQQPNPGAVATACQSNPNQTVGQAMKQVTPGT